MDDGYRLLRILIENDRGALRRILVDRADNRVRRVGFLEVRDIGVPSAFTAESKWLAFVAPIIGVSTPFAQSHASAISLIATPYFSESS